VLLRSFLLASKKVGSRNIAFDRHNDVTYAAATSYSSSNNIGTASKKVGDHGDCLRNIPFDRLSTSSRNNDFTFTAAMSYSHSDDDEREDIENQEREDIENQEERKQIIYKAML
jgi:hypothetical protein